MTRVLVCGGRNFGYIPRGTPSRSSEWYDADRKAGREWNLLVDTLTRLKAERGITEIIHGAAHGADTLAGQWARRQHATGRVLETPFKANWYPNGRSGGLDRTAGFIRNQRMLDEGKPDLVVAFSGGRGTADMVKRARAAGVEVIEVST